MPLHDVDRLGEKGFQRIEEGFCTTPLSTAMRKHFLDRGQSDVAQAFQPTSMEFVQSLGGDPFCGVTEIPLFRVGVPRQSLVDTPTQQLRQDLERVGSGSGSTKELALRYRIEPVPIALQMRLQISFMILALRTLLD